MTLEALAPGSLFADRYRVVRAIARGGMGAVYEVVHLETQRRRALKVILPDVLASEDMRRRFHQEAQIAARIESEFVVDVFDAGVDGATGMPFLVMELLRGEELGARLRRVGRLHPAEVVALLHQTALALDRMRAANVVHRDLKPENLFLTEREDGPPRIKILDLGIAKVIAEGATRSQATRGLGTPLYMAPEQLEAASRVTPATDIYALGMIAFTLLVGRAYFAEDAYECGNVLAFALVVRRGPVEAPDVRAARGGVTLPPAFNVWFARATAAAPEHRFLTAVSAVADLAAALGVATPTTGSSSFAAAALAGPPAPAVPTQAWPSQPVPPWPSQPLPPWPSQPVPPGLVATGSSTGAAPPGATATSLGLTRSSPALRRAWVPATVVAAAILALGAVRLLALGRSSPAPAPSTAASTVEAASVAVPPSPPPPPVERASVTSAPPPDAGSPVLDAGTPVRTPPVRPSEVRPPTREPQPPIYTRD